MTRRSLFDSLLSDVKKIPFNTKNFPMLVGSFFNGPSLKISMYLWRLVPTLYLLGFLIFQTATESSRTYVGIRGSIWVPNSKGNNNLSKEICDHIFSENYLPTQ